MKERLFKALKTETDALPYYNKQINLLDAALFGLIYALTDHGKAFCTASNAMMAHDLRLKPSKDFSTIKKSLAHLEKKKYITREVIRDDRGMVVQRFIRIDEGFKERYRDIVEEQIEQRDPRKRRTQYIPKRRT